MGKNDWKPVADCWCTYELWNVTMENGAGEQVRVRYPAQGDPPCVTLYERPEYSKAAMEVGIAAIEAVEARLKEGTSVSSLKGVIAWMKAPVNWGTDRTGWILGLLIALCEDSDGPGADLEHLHDAILYRITKGEWKE